MKILFVFYNEGSGLSSHLGIATLSAIAKELGHETRLMHVHNKLPLTEFEEDWVPNIIAFTATDFEYEKIREIAGVLKFGWPEAFCILGGKSAVEIATKDTTNTPFDAFALGEAEIPWRELLQSYGCDPETFYSIDGFWFKDGKDLACHGFGKNVENLDDLPFPDWDIFDMDRIIESKGGWMNVQFSRGCIFNCTYCYVSADKRYQGDQYRLRNNSVDYAMRYMEQLLEKFPSIRVFNLDDELPVSIEMHKGGGYSWWLDFCRQFKRRIYDRCGVEFVANGRVNLMTEEIIKTMVESGCRECRMGFESGSERIRRDILDKPITDEKMREVYALCDKYGLKTTSFTMIGIPTETEDDVFDTMHMTADLKPNMLRLTFCYPFEGTRLWFLQSDAINKYKLYKQSGYFEEPVFNTPLGYQKTMTAKFLFPWFVNTIMLEDEDLVMMYAKMIKLHMNDDFSVDTVREKIINIDKNLSDICGNEIHYAYHPNGYFVCKNKVTKN
jgi:radical SAM superfamily enzyme YgiQ (UPF0313 family)